MKHKKVDITIKPYDDLSTEQKVAYYNELRAKIFTTAKDIPDLTLPKFPEMLWTESEGAYHIHEGKKIKDETAIDFMLYSMEGELNALKAVTKVHTLLGDLWK